MDTPRAREQIFGAYVGRFNPPHKGHERIVKAMFDAHSVRNSLIIVCSMREGFDSRNFLTFEERKEFFNVLFPDARVVGLTDVGNDTLWIRLVEELLSKNGIDPARTRFFSGSPEDVSFFTHVGRRVEIIDRGKGTPKDVSGTHIRECLRVGDHHGISSFMDPRITDRVTSLFHARKHLFHDNTVDI